MRTKKIFLTANVDFSSGSMNKNVSPEAVELGRRMGRGEGPLETANLEGLSARLSPSRFAYTYQLGIT